MDKTKNEAALPPAGCVLTTGQILSLERRSNMTDDEALRFARAIESALLPQLRAPVAGEANEQAAFNARYEEVAGRSITIRRIAWHLWRAGIAYAAPQASEANGQWRDLALKFDAQRMVFRDLLKVVAGKLAAVAGARDDEANKMLDMARDALASSPGECLKAQASEAVRK